MKEKKFTYKDWWTGKIYLMNHSSISVPIKEKNKIGKGVDWDNLGVDDVVKIKEKQKELFEELRQVTLQKYKVIFLETYKKSKFKSLYLTDELEDLETLLFGNFGTMNSNETYFLKLKNRDLIQKGSYFTKIKFFINENVKKGREHHTIF